MNDNASLYLGSDKVQRADATETLDKYLNLMQWKDNPNVMDIGSADGGLTSEILLPKLPKNLQKLVGADISDNMVNFAKKRYQGHPKLDFVQLDITQTVPEEFRNHFDGIFSFLCLNWVTKDRQVQALKNMYDMLKRGASLLVTIIVKTPLFDYLEIMAQHRKWAPYSGDVPKYVSMYCHLDKPEEKLKAFLEEVGFEIHLCKLEDRIGIFPGESYYWKWASAINPLLKIVPEEQLGDYKKEFMEEVRKNKAITIEGGDNKKIQMTYSRLVTCVSKPL